MIVDDTNRRDHLGSSFDDGLYSHVNKDLRQILGTAVQSPWSKTYCGGGNLAACRSALWSSLAAAAADLEAEFADPDVADWRRVPADEDVRHTAAGVTSVPAIHWINRPTFQQVVQLPGVIDHYKCYKVRPKASAPSRTLTLADEFETKSTTVQRAELLCNPVDKDGNGLKDPTAHLACYRIRDVAGQPRFARRNVSATNGFGIQNLSVVKARTLCVPSTKDGVPSSLGLDPFKCYRAQRVVPRLASRDLELSDQFETKTMTVKKPLSLCNPVDADGAGIDDPATHLACYVVKNAPGQPRFARKDAAVANDLGAQPLSVLRPAALCVPSSTAIP
jgi:hypothetical protein